MTTQETLSVLLFVGAVAAVYGAAGAIVIRGLWRWAHRRPAPERGHARRLARNAVLALAIAGLGCAVYAYFVEPYWLDVRRVTFTSDKLPDGSGPVRVVHISDLHCDPKVRLEEKLPGVIAGLRPDVIVFTGDAINHRDALGVFQRCMRRLAEIAPTYAVLGNWDVYHLRGTDFYAGTGVTELDGRAVTLDVRGAPICIAGAPVGGGWAAVRALAAEDRRMFTVLLYHYPGAVVEVAESGHVDLVLAGHTHGGQVALPFYGALVTLARHGKRFEAGLYRVGDTHLYVNRGIGMEGGPAPRVRFGSRPEVTVIDIAPPETSPQPPRPPERP